MPEYKKGEITKDCYGQPVEVIADTGDGVPRGYTLVRKHGSYNKVVYPTILPTRKHNRRNSFILREFSE